MGCTQSVPAPSNPSKPGGPDHAPASKGSTKQSEMRLLEEYSVGSTLGEGAFGVVSNCKRRSTGEEFAVKMVDKVETPVEAIKREAQMLQNMDHPNIVKCHGVYYERCFVCIVMDKYAGGDLVEGLQRHLKEKGQINCFHVVHVARQMGASVQYLHRRSVIHRDVKGDNYLMSKKDMTDPDVRIVLTDFGTASSIGQEERLSASVGTKIFWAPEFFDKNYGMKVDVWAIGVVMYGLVTGRFPFRDETDIKTKEVKIPKRVHPTCEEFIKKMLEKKEAARFSSNQVMEHAWVSQGQKLEQGPESKDAAEQSGPVENLRVDTANDGIKERRQELLSRLNKEHELKKQNEKNLARAPTTHAEGSSFELVDKLGNKLRYEWWAPSKVKEHQLLESEGSTSSKAEVKDDASDIKIFSQMLEDHKIDLSQFGTGKYKTLQQLANEVRSGSARLMLDATEHKKLVRVVDIVLLRISYVDGKDRRMLIETKEVFPDRRERATGRLPGTKKEPHENTRQTAERIMKDFLKCNPGMVRFELRKIDRQEEEMESPTYPGVQTVYRKEIVEAQVITKNAGELKALGLPALSSFSATDDESNTKFFEWMTEAQAEGKKVKLKAEASEAISTLVRAPIGLGEEALRAHLEGAGVDVSKFGQTNMKTIKEFSSELIKGEATLMREPGGQITRVVDVVVLVITKEKTGEILVQTEQVYPSGDKHVLNRLPGAKRRPDENQFLSARRILRRQLEIDENLVQLDTAIQNIEEEKPSPSYPGLKTVYRKRLIKATLLSASQAQ